MTSTTVIAFTSISFLCFGAAMPARAQTVTPASRPADTGAQETAAIPDFSGIWAHLTWPDVEPPPAGPGPVRNMSRRNGVSNNYQLVGDYTNPILKPEAAQVVKKAGEVALSGVTYPTPSNQCWPGGVHSFFGISEYRCSSSRTKSRFSTPMIMRSAMYA